MLYYLFLYLVLYFHIDVRKKWGVYLILPERVFVRLCLKGLHRSLWNGLTAGLPPGHNQALSFLLYLFVFRTLHFRPLVRDSFLPPRLDTSLSLLSCGRGPPKLCMIHRPCARQCPAGHLLGLNCFYAVFMQLSHLFLGYRFPS